jgi:hypothetical protein
MRTPAMTWLIGATVSTLACAPSDREPGAVETLPPAVAEWGDSLEAFAAALPDADVRALDLEMALTLVAMPLSCLDRPHATTNDRGAYLDTITATRRPAYEETRAFYGCWDWHSAVNSTWAMVRLNKEFPALPVSGLVAEKLDAHLSESALAGELAFFEESQTFERPYGWAWLLFLYAELEAWDHPDAEEWTDHVEPLASLFSERMVEWLPKLKRPSRSGVHSNTAFSLSMMLEASRATRDTELRDAISEAAMRLFREDRRCPTGYEPWASDFLSPCLEEAALMAEILPATEYVEWFDRFMPPVTSDEFAPLLSPIDPADVVEEVAEGLAPSDDLPSLDSLAVDDATAAAQRLATEQRRVLASTSHLIGLAFIRADAMNRIVSALPAGDPRIVVLRRLAVLHGAMGFDAMFDADYAGSHWIGTFALKYLLTEQGR